MPLVQLLDDSAAPDGWHHVAKPGASELWHFDAQEQDGPLRICLDLVLGARCDAQYQHQYAAYIAHPTRNPPPVPADFAALRLRVFHDEKIRSAQFDRFPPEQFSASANESRVTLGPASLHPAKTGWTISVQDKLDLTFTPTPPHPSIHRAQAGWTIGALLCEVRGQLQSAPFHGIGYHDHVYGDAWGPAGKPCLRGRILLENQSAAFCVGPDHAEVISPAVGYALSAVPVWPPPDRLDLGPLVLRRPRILDRTPFDAALLYDAYLNGQACPAYCEAGR